MSSFSFHCARTCLFRALYLSICLRPGKLRGQGNAFTASNPSLAVAARAFGPSSLNRVSLEISYVVVNMYLYTNNNKIVITPTDAHKAVITVCVLSLSSLTMRAGWTSFHASGGGLTIFAHTITRHAGVSLGLSR